MYNNMNTNKTNDYLIEIAQAIKEDNGRKLKVVTSRPKNFFFKLLSYFTGRVNVDFYTVNETTKVPFLLHSFADARYDNAICNMYIRLLNKETGAENSYTVEWTQRQCYSGKSYSVGETQISYFTAHNERQLLDKFFTGKNENEYLIYSIKLNPMS